MPPALAVIGGAALGGGAALAAGTTAATALAAAGLGAGIGSSIAGSNAASDAAQQQADAAAQAGQTEWAMFQQNRADQLPWLQAGAGPQGLEGLTQRIAAGPGEFIPERQPGYEFGFKNFIEKPYLSSQSAIGQRLSGQTKKGLIQYASDYAENAYQNFLNRYYQSLNPYQSLAGVGQTTAFNLGNMGANVAGNIAGNQLTAGQAQAAGTINSQNAMTQGLQSAFNMAGTLYGNSQNPFAMPGYGQPAYNTPLPASYSNPFTSTLPETGVWV